MTGYNSFMKLPPDDQLVDAVSVPALPGTSSASLPWRCSLPTATEFASQSETTVNFFNFQVILSAQCLNTRVIRWFPVYLVKVRSQHYILQWLLWKGFWTASPIIPICSIGSYSTWNKCPPGYICLSFWLNASLSVGLLKHFHVNGIGFYLHMNLGTLCNKA